MIVKGKIVKGHGVASGISKKTPYPKGSLEMQFPFFKKRGLDLYHFYKGTINVDISPFIWKPIDPDYYLKHVNWTDKIPPESFLFIDCKLLFESKTYPGIIYFPDPKTKVQHFHVENMVEVISVKIPGINYGAEISIEVYESKIDILKK